MANTRAYLSTTDRHLRLAWPSEGLARYYGEQAQIEARMILSETEDDNGHADPVAWARVRDTRPVPVGPVGTYGWERYGFDPAFWSADSRGALAEALAAFIAEPIK